MNKCHGDNMDFFCTTLDSNGLILDINSSPEVKSRYPELTRENLLGKSLDQVVVDEDALLLSMHLDIVRRFGCAQSPVYQLGVDITSGTLISVSSRSQLVRVRNGPRTELSEMGKDDLIFCDNAILSPPTAKVEEKEEKAAEPAKVSKVLPWTFVFSRECMTPTPKYYVFPHQLPTTEYKSCFFANSAWQPQPWTDINVSTWDKTQSAPKIVS
ncbi:uncharacterized protein LOC135941287 [Cloeon dipterum]|uniref:uncharacterized protein LOC135941287 n=1 Tax=Cloeon dipterum TaxID=197152 RepID=UPI00322012BF